MAEHALFFALLMPPEVAEKERVDALRFAEKFGDLHSRIAATEGPIERGDLKRYTQDVVEEIKPFIAWKATVGDAQRNGTLRSLWPLFFDHTKHEAERWTRRLEQLGRGGSEFDFPRYIT
jgi:hypothetical protein